ncbi:MIP/aquaporin family protein [Acidothermaceae bacterium B102]|nr:MIP/aquaporin family protein [Acidothermaceae bacterium B102]
MEAISLALGPAATATVHVQQLPAAQRLDPVAWTCEAVGTMTMLFLGFSSVALVNAHQSPLRHQLPSASLRYALIGAGFGLAVAAVVVSPLGRRSGAHLNTAVTLALWLRGETRGGDALGYVAAQCVGATVAAGAFAGAWGAWASDVHGGRTRPAHGVTPLAATGIELLLTFGLVLAILLIAGSPRMRQWAPVAIAVVVALLIWAGAATTGASFNPARTLGPAFVRGDFTAIWVYVVGPLAGSVLATTAYTRGVTAAVGRAAAAGRGPV